MSADNIKVVIRVRPINERETKNKQTNQWCINGPQIYQVCEDGSQVGENYVFDQVHTIDKSNQDVYNLSVKELVLSSLEGINSTIFAYGQTSSGKTFTMMGTSKNPGVITQAVEEIFHFIEQHADRKFLLRASYVEIYNESLNDLLDQNNKNMKINEDLSGNITYNAKEDIITTRENIMEVLHRGQANRRVGETAMNSRSSRSHTIFRVIIESSPHKNSEADDVPVQVSQLNLIDLAGSERTSQTGATGQRFKEGAGINKSLTVLGLVIKQLVDGNEFISFRDSKLTRILSNSLGGNARTLIICAITTISIEDTISTLQFAQRAKAVKNKPKVNKILSDAAHSKRYAKELAENKQKLEEELSKNLNLQRDKEDSIRKINELKLHIQSLESTFVTMEQIPIRKPKRRHTIGYQTGANLSRSYFCSGSISSHSSLSRDLPSISEELPDNVFIEDIEEPILVEEGRNTPEPTKKDSPGTPAKVLRRRIRDFEKDYNELLEFTKLEKEVKTLTEKELSLQVDKLNKELAGVKKEKDELSQKYRHLCEQSRVDVDTLMDTIRNLQSDLCECQDKLLALNEDLDDMEKQKNKLELLQGKQTPITNGTNEPKCDNNALLAGLIQLQNVLNNNNGLVELHMEIAPPHIEIMNSVDRMQSLIAQQKLNLETLKALAPEKDNANLSSFIESFCEQNKTIHENIKTAFNIANSLLENTKKDLGSPEHLSQQLKESNLKLEALQTELKEIKLTCVEKDNLLHDLRQENHALLELNKEITTLRTLAQEAETRCNAISSEKAAILNELEEAQNKNAIVTKELKENANLLRMQVEEINNLKANVTTLDLRCKELENTAKETQAVNADASEKDAYLLQINDLQNSHQSLQSKLNEIQLMCSEKDNLVQDLRHEKDALLQQSKELNQEILTLRTRVQEVENNHSAICAEKATIVLELEESQKDLRQEKVTLLELNEEITKLRMLAQEMESHSNAIASEKAAILVELEEAHNKNAIVTKQLQQNANLLSMQVEEINTLKGNVKTLELRCTELENTPANETSATSNADATIINEYLLQINDMQNSNEALQTKLQEIQLTCSEKDKLVHNLRQEKDALLEQSKELNKEIQTMRTRAQEAETNHNTVCKEKSAILLELEEAQKNNAIVTKELKNNENLLRAQDDKIKNLELQHKELELKTQAINTSTTQIEEYLSKINDLQNNNQALQTQLEAMQSRCSEKDTLVQDLYQEKDAVLKQLDMLNKEMLDAKRNHNSICSEKDKLIQDLRQEKDALLEQLEILNKEISETNRNNNAICSEKDNLVQALRQEKQALLEQFEILNKEIFEAERKQSAICSEKDNLLQDLRQEKDALLEQFNTLRKEICSEKDNLVQSLRQEKDALLEQFKHLNKEVSEAKRNNNAMCSEKDSLRQENEALLEQFKHLTKEISEAKLNSAICSGKDNLIQTLRQEKDALNDQLRLLSTEMSEVKRTNNAITLEKAAILVELKETQKKNINVTKELKNYANLLRTQDEEINTLKINVKNLELRYKELETSAKKDDSEKTKAITAAAFKIDEYLTRINDLQSNLQRKEATINELKDRILVLDEQLLMRDESGSDSAKSEVSDTTNKRRSMREKIHDSRRSIDINTVLNVSGCAQCQKQRRDSERLKSSLEILHTQQLEKDVMINRLNDEIKSYTTRIKELESKSNDLTTELKKKHQQIMEMMSNKSTTRSTFDINNKEPQVVQFLQSHVDRLEKKLELLQKKNELLQKRNEQLQEMFNRPVSTSSAVDASVQCKLDPDLLSKYESMKKVCRMRNDEIAKLKAELKASPTSNGHVY